MGLQLLVRTAAWLDDHVWVICIVATITLLLSIYFGLKAALHDHDELTRQIARVCANREH